MRCVIARYSFDLTRNGVLASMKGVRPEAVTAQSVTIGRRRYPVSQVGRVITRQDPRDFTVGEVIRAMTRLGFTCHDRPQAAPSEASGTAALHGASAPLDGTGTGPVPV
ncbi:SCO5918 family protein [Streptomyces sp. ME01-24h]|nr:SCO5918 family protein [Streptomyces sp. ME19-03-3]MDX3352955.1 SCO5918 family protein [Streptomyces sp. ME01-24h]